MAASDLCLLYAGLFRRSVLPLGSDIPLRSSTKFHNLRCTKISSSASARWRIVAVTLSPTQRSREQSAARGSPACLCCLDRTGWLSLYPLGSARADAAAFRPPGSRLAGPRAAQVHPEVQHSGKYPKEGLSDRGLKRSAFRYLPSKARDSNYRSESDPGPPESSSLPNRGPGRSCRHVGR